MAFSPITHGATLSTFHTATATITHTAHQPNQRIGWHAHESANIALVTHGEFEERCEPTRWSCRRGDFIAKPPTSRHANLYGGEPTRCLLVEFRGRSLADDPALERLLSAPSFLRDPLIAALGRSIESELELPDAFSEMAVEGAILQIMARAARLQDTSTGEPPRHVLVARDLLHDRIAMHTSLRMLADAAGVTPAVLVRHFRNSFGLTPAEYRRALRMEAACAMIASGDRSLAEVAYACGFASQSHLTHAIRRATGSTPGQLRSQ